MHRMRQRFLSIANPGRSQDPAHGGVPTQMPCMQPQLQPALQSEDPSAHPHRHQTVQLFGLWQSVPTELRPTEAQLDP